MKGKGVLTVILQDSGFRAPGIQGEHLEEGGRRCNRKQGSNSMSPSDSFHFLQKIAGSIGRIWEGRGVGRTSEMVLAESGRMDC